MLKDEKNLQSPTNDFPRSFRLHGRKAIRNVVFNGKKLIGKTLRIHYIEGETTGFAISVPKSYGKAVARNKVKRIVREFLRQNKKLWPEKYWILIRVMKKPDKETQVIEELKNLFEHIK